MDQNGKDDLKTQFVTREGTYRLITLSEYSRPNRVGYQSNQNNPQVRVSLLPAKPNTTATTATNDTGKTAFNVGSTVSSTISTNTAATNTVGDDVKNNIKKSNDNVDCQARMIRCFTPPYLCECVCVCVHFDMVYHPNNCQSDLPYTNICFVFHLFPTP